MLSILDRAKRLEKKEEATIKYRATNAFNIITTKKKSPAYPKKSPAYPKKSPTLITLRSALKKKTLIDDNPKLRLSIEDYNLMCKNKILKKMMAKVLNIDANSLTAFCKDAKVLDKHIDLSISTIKENRKAKTSPIKDLAPELLSSVAASKILLSHLSDDILHHITSHSLPSLFKFKYKMVKYKLVDGIPEYKLHEGSISKNPNALYYLIDNGLPINYFWLSYNTNPIAMGLLAEEMKVNPSVHLDWNALSKNSEAMKIVKANRDKISWGYLSLNTNPKAMKLLEEELKVNPTHINFENLANNETPEAMKIIEDNLLIENSIYNNINWNRFWEILSRNSKAVKILRANRGKVDWCSLCGNQSTEAIKLLEEKMETEPDIVNWIILSGNPNQRAFAMLEANPKKINLRRLSSNTNPKAIELLNKRMEVENNLSEATYDSISTSDKIDWNLVSKNPNAIELLKKRIIYEDNLTINRRRRLKNSEVIDWNHIAENPSIFTIE